MVSSGFFIPDSNVDRFCFVTVTYLGVILVLSKKSFRKRFEKCWNHVSISLTLIPNSNVDSFYP